MSHSQRVHNSSPESIRRWLDQLRWSEENLFRHRRFLLTLLSSVMKTTDIEYELESWLAESKSLALSFRCLRSGDFLRVTLEISPKD